MNILFDHQIFCMQQYGGVSRYFYELARHIAGIPGNQVEICASLYSNEYLSKPGKIRLNGIKTRPILIGKILVETIDGLISSFRTRSRYNIDIFHETYFSLMDGCPSSAKRIVTVHDMIHEKSIEKYSKWDRTLRSKPTSVRRADHIICVSENTRKDLIEIFNVPEKKTSVIHLGCTLTRKKNINPSVIDKPYLLYVGKRNGYKNFKTFLTSYARSLRLANEFSLICFGGGKFNTSERQYMTKLGLSPENVIQISGGDEILAGLYSSAKALVFPSLYEGFGIPPLEAMSFDCPVVCSNTSSMPEVVGDAAEFFNPADEDDIGAAIERVVSSLEKSSQLIIKGKARVKQFSWVKCGQKTINVYQKILQD